MLLWCSPVGIEQAAMCGEYILYEIAVEYILQHLAGTPANSIERNVCGIDRRSLRGLGYSPCSCTQIETGKVGLSSSEKPSPNLKDADGDKEDDEEDQDEKKDDGDRNESNSKDLVAAVETEPKGIHGPKRTTWRLPTVKTGSENSLSRKTRLETASIMLVGPSNNKHIARSSSIESMFANKVLRAA
ncbi:MAG: hypothetical protein Q9215_002912 [Flavoplaca cf. flavocitrina]